MTMQSSNRARTHVLLVGIDAYAGQPLSGCVNDVVAMRDLLIARLGVSESDITLLAAPSPSSGRTLPAAERPTGAAIRAALERLASDAVGAEDRVIVHYSGHGASQRVSGAGKAHLVECIVPVDFGPDPASLLYDIELNRRIAAIEARTTHVTLIFDCCHSAGVTRAAVLDRSAVARRMRLAPITVDATASDDLRAMLGTRSRGISTLRASAVTVAACLADEVALETTGTDRAVHGVLTRSLLAALGASDPAITWGEIWSSVLSAARPGQNPMLYGDERHMVFGPLVLQDRGDVPVVPEGDAYTVRAGTLVDVTPHTTIAVYGATPERFAPIGSAEDVAARVGELTVVSATPLRATAHARRPFAWPPAARARITSRATPSLPVSFDSPASPDTLARLAKSASFAVVEDGRADVRLVRRGDAWVLCDDVHGLVEEGRPELVRCSDQELLRVLDTYADYRMPLRLAARCTDLPGALDVRLLDARDLPVDADLQDPDLPEIGEAPDFRYAVKIGDPFCIVVENRSRTALRSAALLNCATSGQVQHIASFVLPASGGHALWAGEKLGEPFTLEGPPGVERLVVIASTRPDADWRFLETSAGFRDAVRSFKSFTTAERDRFTATTVAVRVT